MAEQDASNEIRVARCPICGKARQMAYRPFCSKRCADVDLGRWFNGSYAMPASPEEDEDGVEHDFAVTPGAGKQRDLS